MNLRLSHPWITISAEFDSRANWRFAAQHGRRKPFLEVSQTAATVSALDEAYSEGWIDGANGQIPRTDSTPAEPVPPAPQAVRTDELADRRRKASRSAS